MVMIMEKQEKTHNTKYEKARIIGARATQIAMGAPYLIKFTEEELKQLRYSPLAIAKLEFEQDLIQIKVRRTPAGHQ